MTAISGRYGFAILGLLIATCAVVWWTSADTWRQDDCAHPEAFRALEFVGDTWQVKQRPDFVAGNRIQWTEGFAGRRGTGEPRFTFRVIRTFDPYYLLVRPKGLMPRGFAADWARVEEVPNLYGESPIQLLFKERGSKIELIAYVYFYQGAAVRRPFFEVFASGLKSFLQKTRPVTVVLVYGSAPKSEMGALETAAITWLESVREHYRDSCHPRM